jgi:hypothetical protein
MPRVLTRMVTYLIVCRVTVYRDLSGERVFCNPPWELAKHIDRHFDSCKRTYPTSTMAVFILPKRAKFNDLSRYLRLHQEFPLRTPLFLLFPRQSMADPTK